MKTKPSQPTALLPLVSNEALQGLLGFAMFGGMGALIAWYCHKGTMGSNRYGEDPL